MVFINERYSVIVELRLQKVILTATNYTLTVNPLFYYEDKYISFENKIIYNSNKPTNYPDNGKFKLLNKERNITINEITGELEIKILTAKKYIIDVLYYVNNKILNAQFILIVVPTIIYKNPIITIASGILYKSEKPIVNPIRGIFTSNNLPTGCSLDKYNGIVKINKKELGNYTIVINYIINYVSISTNFTFIII